MGQPDTRQKQDNHVVAISQSDASWHGSPNLTKLTLSLGFLTMFGSAVGYDGSMSNGLLALPQWTSFMGQPAGAWLGFINAIYWVSFGLGIPFAAWSADRFGRKFTVYLGFIPLVIGTALETAAPNDAVFIVGRAILGFPSAVFGNVVPLLVAECAHPKYRGVLTSFYFTGFYIGATIAAWATFGTRNYTTSWAWRVPCILQLLCPLVGLIGLIPCPESPRWLVSKDRVEEAREILKTYHSATQDDPIVETQMLEIQAAVVDASEVRTAGYADMFRTRPNLHRVAITVTLGIFSQWVGNGVVSYYLSLVLNTVGLTTVTEQTLISGCLQIWNWIFAIAGAMAVERFGRRKLFLLSFAIMLVSYIVITACSGSFAQSGHRAVGMAVVPFLVIYFAGYDIAVTPLQVAYPVEIWPYHLRSQGLGLAWLSMLIGVIFNVFVNPIALDAIGWKYYFVFVALLMVYGALIYFLFPETRGLSLEQIDTVFQDGAPSSTVKVYSEEDKPTKDHLHH
ncbi:hypothetical protein NW762_008936 [Fusarium torreyae]|uniref:Major facilitator superfamily (MFS) profile domain-containing protein n=1 Tax=Fusarium torreyae TaxID=1237075 RepID=A0A9W8RUU0_9HYPO|nr:hypothetical protein NW762_008936 [Fusarium torreyae]